MFSPLAFPAGMIVYDFTTSLPPASHLSLFPFELHREPIAIIAIADGAELSYRSHEESMGIHINGNGSPSPEFPLRELDQELESVRDQFPKALVHQLLIFDYVHPERSPRLPEGLVAIAPLEESKLTTMKTVMCDISSMLLAEMTTLAKSLQGMAMIESPNQGNGTRGSNGYSWPTGSETLSRRNSQNTSGSRNESPVGKADRSNVRMSMPAQLRSSASDPNQSNHSSRPTTPMSGSQSDLEGRMGSKSPENNAISRVNATERFREHSRDRISVQGFGSGSLSEKSRTKGKGRIGIVIGSLYLQAGRWGDALRELVDGALIAQSNNDHLWHAKALENILVTMLMFAWAGLDFQIPQICYQSVEKAPYHTPSASALELPKQSSLSSTRLVSLQNLSGLLPEFLDKILNKYTRITGESLTQLPFSEIVIRFSKLLTLVHLSEGKLDDQVLQLVVQGTPFRQSTNVEIPRLNVHPPRSFIIAMLFRAFPSSSTAEDLPIIDRTIILGGIASVLDSLGYYRKKAMVIWELVSVLIPGLVQARKIGAAEMGIHPAAGLAALNTINGIVGGASAFELGEGDVEKGVDDLLGLMCRIYGTVTFESSTAGTVENNSEEGFDDSDGATTSRILNNCTLRAFGSRNLKMNVLRACINMAEALPDFQGVLRFSSDLLRTAGSGVAPGPHSENASPSMTREEQVRLATNITRTVSAAKKLGLQGVEAEYWDEFLVRGVELEPQQPSRIPIPHQMTELSGATAAAEAKERNPFIYNPFLKRPDAADVEHLLVAEESATFKVTLQNPYEFDVEIESIRLESNGVDFISGVQSTVIGPYRTQILTITGTPKSSGSLTITGCLIKIIGCRERRFPIFTESWTPQSDTKLKATGLAVVRKRQTRPVSLESASKLPPSNPLAPKTTSLEPIVIEKQPVVVVKSSSSAQSAAMVLEGERQTFTITLQNLSDSIPVDLLLFSFQDSTKAPLQTALSNRDASPAELYEYELILSRKQALRWIKRENEVPYIEPGSSATFLFEMLGKPGLTSGTVQIDYAYLGVPASEVQQRFYTRQVVFPLTMTVNASVELARMDVLPLAGDVPAHLWPGGQVVANQYEGVNSDEYCLLMLDLRNAWPSQLHVHLDIAGGRSIEEDILPGSTSRIIFPIRRVILDNPFASIPALDPSRQRQFIVSTGKVSADSERATREAFWYREEILKTLSGTWKTASGQERSGIIELRGIRLSPRMVEAIKIEEISVELQIDANTSDSDADQYYQVCVDEFINLKARIRNRTSHPVFPLLRFQPSLRNHSHNSSLDLSKKLVWDGTLQYTLPEIPANGSTEESIGMTALCRGKFEINASVEEARLWESPETDHNEADGGRSRANTRAIVDSVLGVKERRIWHTREPCIVVVRDNDSSDDDDDDDDDDV
jgi:trafficking protein particle complex subunit 9